MATTGGTALPPRPAAERRARMRRRGLVAIPAPVAPARRPRWETQYVAGVVAIDITAILIACVVAAQVRFSAPDASIRGIPYDSVAFLATPLWVGVIAASRGYEKRFMGVGSDEFRRVIDGSVRLLALVATISYAFKIELARGFIAVALPLGTVLLVAGRHFARVVLHRLRDSGKAVHCVLVVGARDTVLDAVRQMERAPHAGFRVIGVCVPDPENPVEIDGREIPALGVPLDAAAYVGGAGADTLVVAGGWAMGAEGVRRLAWQLEGTGVDLVVAPSITNVAGPRISIRPVAGLPLLHVEEPEFTGVRRVIKEGFDRLAAGAILVASLPVLAVAAVAIKLSSPGPVVFRQERIGRAERAFCIWKLRTMYVDAEQRLRDLEALNEAQGPLFKMRRDPRVTPAGQVLRRFSLDELPQLWNVVRGDMSLVGPRPPLPREVEGYGRDTRRRLLVKPGLTGLWQVSGRSDLTWEESIRLDLHYVENWSVALDLQILYKTLGAVIRGRGAY